MPHPITIIYKSNYKKFLKIFIERLPYSYIKYTKVTNIVHNEKSLRQIQEDFEFCVSNNSEKIFIVTSNKINTYLHDFSVFPKGSIDEFKTIFFLAQTIAEFLARDGLNTVAKINLSTMVWLLDFRLKYKFNANRPILAKESIKMIQNDTLFKKTGEVGLYLTYKCLYNQAQELK